MSLQPSTATCLAPNSFFRFFDSSFNFSLKYQVRIYLNIFSSKCRYRKYSRNVWLGMPSQNVASGIFSRCMPTCIAYFKEGLCFISTEHLDASPFLRPRHAALVAAGEGAALRSVHDHVLSREGWTGAGRKEFYWFNIF